MDEYYIIKWKDFYFHGLTHEQATSWVLARRNSGWFSRETAEKFITIISILEDIEQEDLTIEEL